VVLLQPEVGGHAAYLACLTAKTFLNVVFNVYCSLVQEVMELQVQLARLNAKLDEAENARRILDTARRDLEKDIQIKVGK
jgi:predicted RNA binding protein with dsRBD fold (UPF0201 family)